jgi:hypothetical protein
MAPKLTNDPIGIVDPHIVSGREMMSNQDFFSIAELADRWRCSQLRTMSANVSALDEILDFIHPQAPRLSGER